MMGVKQEQKELFHYQIDLDRRVRADHPLRKIREQIDFTFVRNEVKDCYGYNGNEPDRGGAEREDTAQECGARSESGGRKDGNEHRIGYCSNIYCNYAAETLVGGSVSVTGGG